MRQQKNLITQISTKMKKIQPNFNLINWIVEPGWKYKNITLRHWASMDQVKNVPFS
jgi:hypothetical protein